MEMKVMRRESPKTCLILSGNVGIGYQVASLLEHHGWQTNVVHSSLRAYDCIQTDNLDTMIADIDTADLGGLAVLAFCHHRNPAITSYAIVQADDEYKKKMARDAAGCRGYFYLMKGSLRVDPDRGMAAELAAGFPSGLMSGAGGMAVEK
jgi:DNA-binding NtrC family response regulator